MLKVATLRFQSILNLAFLVFLAAFLGLFIAGANYDWQGLLLVGGGLGILAVFLLPRLARSEGEGFLKVLVFALLLKLVFAMVNYYIAFVIYGVADASMYHRSGIIISNYIWNFQFDKVALFLNWSTDFIKFFTGVIYAIIGPSIFGGYLVFTFLSFLGSYYFYRAFRLAFPDGSKGLYAALIFFFPTILFWSSAIGKDALMSLSLGLLAYGGAKVIVNWKWSGIIPLALGFTGALWVRPHIAAISIVALALAFLLPGGKRQHFNPAVYIIGLAMVAGLAWYLLPQVMSFLNLKQLSSGEIIDYLYNFQIGSGLGGSAYQGFNLYNPVSYFLGPITVLFRPFPWEAHNLQALMESLAAIFLLFLILWRIKSVGRAIASLITNTYSRYIIFYFIAFTLIFTAIVNFGTLVRERVMIQPFLFMLISYNPSRLIEKPKLPAETAEANELSQA